MRAPAFFLIVFSLASLLTPAAASPRHAVYPRSSPPFGEIIVGCTVPGVIALAFDDGPGKYTEDNLGKYVKALLFGPETVRSVPDGSD